MSAKVKTEKNDGNNISSLGQSTRNLGFEFIGLV